MNYKFTLIIGILCFVSVINYISDLINLGYLNLNICGNIFMMSMLGIINLIIFKRNNKINIKNNDNRKEN